MVVESCDKVVTAWRCWGRLAFWMMPTGVLAGRVSACSITYSSGVTERGGLVSIQLVLSADGESVSLYHEVQVNNVP